MTLLADWIPHNCYVIFWHHYLLERSEACGDALDYIP